MKIGFLEIGISDVLDILLVGILFFQLYKILKGSLAFNIFIGSILLYWMWLLVRLLDMQMLSSILGQFMGSGFVLLMIVFQPEIRRFLFYLGRGSGIGKEGFWRRFMSCELKSIGQKQAVRDEIVRSLYNMAATRTGALVVITDATERDFFVNTGVAINGEISSKLLESIFDKGSPLHDGAVVISDYRIWAAGCVLPVSENPDLPKRVGMRHRAAAGISEQIDADVLIVSEETGKISHARKGVLQLGLTRPQIITVIDEAFESND